MPKGYDDLIPGNANQPMSPSNGGGEDPPKSSSYDDLIPGGGGGLNSNASGQGKSWISTSLDSVGALFSGAQRGIESTIEGYTQSALQGLGKLGLDTAEYQQRLAALRQARIAEFTPTQKEHPISSGIGQVAGGALAGTVVPAAVATAVTAGAAPAAGLGIGGSTFAGRVALGAGASGANAAASTYGTPEEKAAAGYVGATLGGALTAATNLPGKLIKNPEATVANYATAEANNVPITLGQASGNSALQKTEQALSNVPGVGTKSTFEAQAAGAGNMAKEFVDTVKSEVPDSITGKGTAASFGQAVQDTMSANKQTAKELYDTFAQKAAASSEQIPLKNMQELAKQALESEAQFPGQISSAVKSNLKAVLARDTVSPSDLTKLNHSINAVIADLPADASSSKAIMRQMKDALYKDLEPFAQGTGGDVAEAFTKATDFYKSNIGALKDNKILGPYLNGKIDSDRLLDSAIKKNTPEMTASVMKNLNQEGQGQLRAAVVSRAFNDAVKDGVVDPVKFVNNLSKLGGSLNEFLTRPQMAQFTGMRKFFDTIHSGLKEGASKGVTGEVAVGAAEIAALLHAPVHGAAAIGGGALLSKALTSPTVGKMLVKLATKDPNSLGGRALITGISNVLGQMIGPELSRPDKPREWQAQ